MENWHTDVGEQYGELAYEPILMLGRKGLSIILCDLVTFKIVLAKGSFVTYLV